jgi:hypothetical protein
MLNARAFATPEKPQFHRRLTRFFKPRPKADVPKPPPPPKEPDTCLIKDFFGKTPIPLHNVEIEFDIDEE